MEALIAHQELFLRILSFLDSPAELAKVQGVGRYWQRMALDPQLWKRLYLSKYPHPHHSKLVYSGSHAPPVSSSPTARNDDSVSSTPRPLRPIARLPSRAFPPPSPSRSPSASSLRPGTGTATPLAPPSGPLPGVGYAHPLSRREAAESAVDEVGSGVRNDGVDWKMMMRLGTNWSRGNASSQSTITLPPSPSPSITSDLPHETLTRSPAQNTGTEQHIALSPSFIFTSNPTSPLVHVYAASSGQSPSTRLGIIPPPPGWSSPSRPDNITAIAADQSVPESDEDEGGGVGAKRDLPVRLAVFYQSGGYVVLSIRTTDTGGLKSLVWAREAILPPTFRPRRRTTTYAPRMGDPVVLAVLHFPVLITCTQGFHVSVYTLSPSPSTTPVQPNHLSTLHSDVSYHPAALSLCPNSLNADTSFRASLTYCTPVYPSSWTVAAQEFDISLSSSAEAQVHRAECYNVGSSPDDSEDEEIVWPRRVKPVIGVKGRAGGIGTDGRWCILSGGDNQIQVYALPGSGLATPPPSPPFGHRGKRKRTEGDGNIVHSQTLLAHSAKVTSVSLSAGRCVSGGNDGRVLVWNLDDESGEEGRVGRTVGYVEVRTDEERVWRGAAGPRENLTSAEDGRDGETSTSVLPHPQAISSAARTFFLPRPPIELELEHEDRTRRNVRPAIRQLAFDEEKIVGLVSGSRGQGRSGEVGEVMKVWSFG